MVCKCYHTLTVLITFFTFASFPWTELVNKQQWILSAASCFNTLWWFVRLLCIVCMPAVWYSALQVFERLDSCCCVLLVCQQFGTVLYRCLRDWTAAVVCCWYASSAGTVLYRCLRDWTAAVVTPVFFQLFWGLTRRCQADTVLILLDNYCLSLCAGTVSCTWAVGCVSHVSMINEMKGSGDQHLLHKIMTYLLTYLLHGAESFLRS